MRTAGFVLIGGNSSRMGQDKALLPWRDRTLVESIAAQVRDAAGSVALAGNSKSKEMAALEYLPDLRPGLGPLSGIETALASGRGELNLIVACDLPLLESHWLEMLLETAAIHNSKCVVARDRENRVHPLCAVYRTDCLPAVTNALDNRRLKVMDVIEEIGAEQLQLPVPLWNINTPEEWRRCQEIANGW